MVIEIMSMVTDGDHGNQDDEHDNSGDEHDDIDDEHDAACTCS